jgi:L-malate glycosyltransferase
LRIAMLSVESRSIHFRTYLAHLLEQGHEVTVITNARRSDLPTRVVGISGRVRGRLKIPGMGVLARLWRLRRALRSQPFDVLDIMPVTPDGVLAAWLWQGPLVLDFWGSDILRLETRPWWIRRLMPGAIAKADRIHSVSSHMTRVLVEMGAHEDRIETFQYGIDLSLFSLAAMPEPSERVLCTRGLQAFYRVETVIKAMPRVLQVRPSACLVVTRTNGPLDELKALAAAEGVSAQILFVGQLTREALAEELRRSAAWVSIPPTDGAPLSLLEAMASGPVPIVSDLATVREWLDENRAIFVQQIDPAGVADAIVKGLALAESGLHAVANRRVVEERGDRRINLLRWEGMLAAAVECRLVDDVGQRGSGHTCGGGRPPKKGQ